MQCWLFVLQGNFSLYCSWWKILMFCGVVVFMCTCILVVFGCKVFLISLSCLYVHSNLATFAGLFGARSTLGLSLAFWAWGSRLNLGDRRWWVTWANAYSSTFSKTKEVSSKGQNSTIASAKAKCGRVKMQHWRDTLLYYCSPCNLGNAMLLEIVCNAMLLSSSALGPDFWGWRKRVWFHAPSACGWSAQPPSPMSNNDACNIDVSNVIVLNMTSEGGDNVKHVANLTQVSGDETDVADIDEDATIHFGTKITS